MNISDDIGDLILRCVAPQLAFFKRMHTAYNSQD